MLLQQAPRIQGRIDIPNATAATLELRRENDEITAFRFRLDSHGALVPASVNSLYKPLRVAAR